ncbi:MAG: tetratricopeptide repeat protein [Rikenellaceae bacterium]|nr:tetratricopeptide repeat protein [Rikenellaceae bacterium]MCL2692513.1 tetratricopeptide repeat protein [Rikenellaceae bacterium]
MRKLIIACILVFSSFATAVFEANAQLDKRYFYLLGRGLLQDERYGEAIEVINVLIKIDPEQHEAYFLRGIAKYSLGDLLGAEHDFSTAIQLYSVYTMAYNVRAITRARIGNFDDALRDFDEAIRLRPDIVEFYLRRGIVYLQSGEHERALEDLDRFIRRNDKVAHAYILRGEAYLHLGDTVRANEQYDRAVEVNYLDPSGYYQRGVLAAGQERYDAALADFDAALERDSTYLPAYFSRAVVYSQTLRPMLALADLDRVIELDDSYMVAFFNRALVHSSLGNYNKALDDYNTVARYNPNNVLVFYNRAALNVRLGDYAAAIADYTRAIELYPDFANAYLFRSELRALMNDERGSRRDREIADMKLAEHRARIATEDEYSIYADTARTFRQLLSFDTRFARGGETTAARAIAESGVGVMQPMFRFSLERARAETPVFAAYTSREMERFMREVGNSDMRLTMRASDIAPEELAEMDRELERRVRESGEWTAHFERGITQTLVRQYTNAVRSLTAAIERNPTNPFLYLNRSMTRVEMIDFIASIESNYQSIALESGDPDNRLRINTASVYNYDEAMSDLNRAIQLLPDFAHSYYNRGNLHLLSGRMPEAYEDYTRAIELFPNFAEAYYNRGLVQIYMKDTRKGLLDMSKAGELGIREAYEVLRAYAGVE